MRVTGSSALNFLVWDRASQADYYYDVSASTYDFLGVTYGFSTAVHAALIGYLGGDDGPFSGILRSESHGTEYFYAPSVIEAKWARAFRTTF